MVLGLGQIAKLLEVNVMQLCILAYLEYLCILATYLEYLWHLETRDISGHHLGTVGV